MATKYITCPYCDSRQSANALFCSKCGKNIMGIITCPHCGDKQKSNAVFCSNCGKNIVGVKTQQHTNSSTNNSKKSNDSGLIVSAIGAFLLILAFIIGAGALALQLFQNTGRGKFPIVVWILAGIIDLLFGGNTSIAFILAVMLGLIGGLCCLVGGIEQHYYNKHK